MYVSFNQRIKWNLFVAIQTRFFGCEWQHQVVYILFNIFICNDQCLSYTIYSVLKGSDLI